MEIFEATEAFSSLSQETRLKVFLILIEYGRDGLEAGKIAERLKIPNNTLSFHLSHMNRSGLVSAKKIGRTVTYFANTDLINELIKYLKSNCCAKESGSRRRKC